MGRYLKVVRFILFWGLGGALVAWPLLPQWAVRCGVAGAIFAVVIEGPVKPSFEKLGFTGLKSFV